MPAGVVDLEQPDGPPPRSVWFHGRATRIAVAVIALLVLVGTAAAFAVTQSLKLMRPPVTAPRFDRSFSPVCGCEQATAHLTVRFRQADRVRASIVDSSEREVRVLVEDQPVQRGDVEFQWDGRSEVGELAPDGRYRLRLELARRDRTILIPTTFRIDTAPPDVRILRAGPTELSPDRDGVNERVRIRYRTSERGTPLLRIGSAAVKFGKHRSAGRAAIVWGGQISGAAAPAGEYRLSLQVRDDAGNLSAPLPPIDVRVDFVELEETELTSERGAELTFHVRSDRPFAWQLIRPARSGRSGRTFIYEARQGAGEITVQLPRAARPGRYLLRVMRSGDVDTADVRIRRQS